jgi:AcrR family transcriptional regulator
MKAGEKRITKAARMSQAERTAISDGRMYDAAIHLIGEKGTHNTTLKDVGERAGYSRGLASNRFGSKEALFRNIVHDFNMKWASELALHVGERTGLSAFMSAIEAVERFLIDQPDHMRAMYILWYESISNYNDLRSHLAEYHEAYRRDVSKWIAQGIEEGCIDPKIDPQLYAVQFCSYIFGTIYQWLVSPENIDISGLFQYYRELAYGQLAEPNQGAETHAMEGQYNLLDVNK